MFLPEVSQHWKIPGVTSGAQSAPILDNTSRNLDVLSDGKTWPGIETKLRHSCRIGPRLENIWMKWTIWTTTEPLPPRQATKAHGYSRWGSDLNKKSP